MTRHKFYVGTTTKHEKPLPKGALTAIAARLIEAFGGVTQYRTVGGWTDPQGHVKEERAVVFECLGDIGAVEGNILAAWIRERATQSAVLHTVETIEGSFV